MSWCICWVDCEICGAAEDGIETERLIRQLQPDILISDIHMPGKDGLEIARFVADEKYDMKIIFLTGYNEFSYAQEAINSGIFEYLLKPVNSEDLQKTVQKAIANLEEKRKLHHRYQKYEQVFHHFGYDLCCEFIRQNTMERRLGAQTCKDKFHDMFELQCHRYIVAVLELNNEAPTMRDEASWTETACFLKTVFDQKANGKAACYITQEQERRLILFACMFSEGFSFLSCMDQVQIHFFQEKQWFISYGSSEVFEDFQYIPLAFQQAKEAYAKQKTNAVGQNSLAVQQIIKYLHENFSKCIGLQDVASLVNMNASYVSRIIKKETGQGFLDNLLEIRIEKAKMLLRSPDYHVYEIADIVGIGTSKYFSQIFHKKTGMTPMQYRNKAAVTYGIHETNAYPYEPQ